MASLDFRQATARTTRRAASLGVAFAVVGGVLALGPAALAAQTPVITSPTGPTCGDPMLPCAHLSIASADADSATAGFQTTVSGTSEPSKFIEVFARQTKVGETTASGTGEWSVQVTLLPGESRIGVTAKDSNSPVAQPSAPAEARYFVTARYVSTWYDTVNSAGNWVLVANPGAEAARADVFIGGQKRGDTLTIGPNQAAFPTFPDVVTGPVEVHSLDARPLVVTLRTTWTSGDLEEIPAVFDGWLTRDAWFSWYDTRGTAGRDWVVVTNFGTGNASVQVKVAGTSIGQQTVQPGKSGVFNAGDVVGGPVQVTANQPILASRRTQWTPSNFTELVGVPDRWLADRYLFTWFDSVNTQNNDWILVANPNAAQATVSIDPPGAATTATFTLNAGEARYQQFANLIGGPVDVTSDLPIIATQRALWRSGTSFEEVNGVPPAEVNSVYWQSWYDAVNSRDDRMLQGALPGIGANVEYTVKGPSINATETLQPGAILTPAFPGKAEGPLAVSGNGPFLQSKRTLWGGAFPNSDFMEIPGLRGTTKTGQVTALAAPTAMQTVDVPNDNGTGLVVAWTPPANSPTTDGFWVYRTIGSGAMRRIAFAPNGATVPGCPSGKTCIADLDVPKETQAAYEVVALSMGILQGLAGQVQGTPVDDPPSAPVGLGGQPRQAGVFLNWDGNPPVEEVASYKVYQGTDPTPGSITSCDQPPPGGPTYAVVGTPQDSELEVTGLTNGTQYCFKVSAVDGKGQEGTASAPIDLTPSSAAPQMTVVQPNGGEVICGNCEANPVYEITWVDLDSDGDKGSVKIEYTTADNPMGLDWVVIDPGTPNDGSYQWNPPDTLESDSVRVRVTATDLGNNTGADTSDAPFVVDTQFPEVTVTSPVDSLTGEPPGPFRGGFLLNVQWNSTETNAGANPVSLSYTTDNENTFTPIAECTNTLDDGNCTWTVPAIDAESVMVRVTIVDAVGHSSSDLSDVFRVDSTKPASPSIYSVDGGTDSPAAGTSPSPAVEIRGTVDVGGVLQFDADAAQVKLFDGAKPNCATSTPIATKSVGDTQDAVVLNEVPGTSFTLTQLGIHRFWACTYDAAGNASAEPSAEFVYDLLIS